RFVVGLASASAAPDMATATTNHWYDWAKEATDIATANIAARHNSPRRSPTTSTTCPATSDVPAATPNMIETSSPTAARDRSHSTVRNGANALTAYSPNGGIAIPAVATPVVTRHRLANPPPLPAGRATEPLPPPRPRRSRAGTPSSPTADRPREDLMTRVGGDRA